MVHGVTISDSFDYSIQNWVQDLYWKQLDINYPGMDDAMVIAISNFIKYYMKNLFEDTHIFMFYNLSGTPWFLLCLSQYKSTA